MLLAHDALRAHPHPAPLPRYRDLALECAAWLDGHNPAGRALYDPHTGSCADGISAGTVSPHCGAESAIEAGFIAGARQRLLHATGIHDGHRVLISERNRASQPNHTMRWPTRCVVPPIDGGQEHRLATVRSPLPA